IALRKALPELADPRLTEVRVDYDEQDRWLVVHRGGLRVAANLGRDPVTVPLTPARVLLASDERIGRSGDGLAMTGRSLAIVRPVRTGRPGGRSVGRPPGRQS